MARMARKALAAAPLGGGSVVSCQLTNGAQDVLFLQKPMGVGEAGAKLLEWAGVFKLFEHVEKPFDGVGGHAGSHKHQHYAHGGCDMVGQNQGKH